MTLTEFLTARLDEDEAAAKAATPGPWEYETFADHDPPVGLEHTVTASGIVVAGLGYGPPGSRPESDGRHIVRHDPARVLREVEAKRKILGEHGPSRSDVSRCRACTAIDQNGAAARFRAPCPTLRALAAVYSDHPDYREDWG